MDDPIQDSPHVVYLLTQGSPKEQEDTLNSYFTPNASFTHPFCRTGSFEGSRQLIHAIYRWYKIISPTIHITVNSVAYDETNLILYMNMTQRLAIWAIPFHYCYATLTTELYLTRPPNSRKYYIKAQNDLYQADQIVQYIMPWGIGTVLVYSWHFWSTLVCLIGSLILAPITWWEQGRSDRRRRGSRENVNGSMRGDGDGVVEEGMRRVTGVRLEQKEQVRRFGNMQVVK